MNLGWIPAVEVESAHGTREVSLATRHLMNRRIFLTGDITADMANTFLAQLMYLESEGEGPVTIYINSLGGEVTAGLMIYDAIQASKLDIRIVCTGIAASMAALILAGGRKDNRFILKHSKVMIHEPLIQGGVGGSATSIRHISDSILETREIVNGILAEHTGKTIAEVNQDTKYDNYMNAEKAVEYGICDGILESIF